jgi:hypothetical protein
MAGFAASIGGCRAAVKRHADPQWKPGGGGIAFQRDGLQAFRDLLSIACAKSINKRLREVVMAKGQMRSNKEKKKPKADKNLKKGGAAPNPFAAGKPAAGQSPNSKKS